MSKGSCQASKLFSSAIHLYLKFGCLLLAPNQFRIFNFFGKLSSYPIAQQAINLGPAEVPPLESAWVSFKPRYSSFFTKSELIEPFSPLAAKLYFFFHFTQLEMHLLLGDLIKDTPPVKERRKRWNKKKAPHPAGCKPMTSRGFLSWRMIYRCATTAAQIQFLNVWSWSQDPKLILMFTQFELIKQNKANIVKT